MKSISANKAYTLILVLMAFAMVAPVIAEPVDSSLAIDVIYPREGQRIGAVDSTFIFGKVPVTAKGPYRLAINDKIIDVHKDGGFLAFLPVRPGPFVFKLEAWRADGNGPQSISLSYPDRLVDSVLVQVPEPMEQLPIDTVRIVSDYHRPSGDMVLGEGDRLRVQFLGTPDCRAWFSVEGLADSIHMAEIAPRPQSYWGESVFGAGAVPDSMLIHGIYTGFLDIDRSMTADDADIAYHLAPPSPEQVLQKFFFDPLKYHRYLAAFIVPDANKTVTRQSSYKITVNHPDYPFTVRFTDSVQIIRHGPRKGYFAIFQPAGVEAEVIGAEGDWYKVRMSETQTAWVAKASAMRLPKGTMPHRSDLRAIRTYAMGDRTRIEFPLAGKHPFRIIEDDRRTLRVQLFGVRSDTDWIRYDASDKLIDLATWSQPEEDLYELKVALTEDIYGYDTFFKGNRFYLEVRSAPNVDKKLKGKIIVIDPGHSSDVGAVGPTGLTEANANLAIALEVRKELQKRGAIVIMTRDDTSHVDLYGRPAIAKANHADLFVSIHNNALPDGVNPYTHNGSSVYYYHPHSIDLARSIHKQLLKETKLKDHGLYYGNLAVNRPTQYPAVLVECAFIILPDQEALIQTKKFHKQVAKGIRKGIEEYFKELKDGRD